MRHLLNASLVCPAFLSLMAWGAEKPAKCMLEGKNIVSHSVSGIPQISNLGDIEIRCSVPARPFPTKPGESRNGLKATATSYKISPNGSKESVVSEVNVVGGGFDHQQEWVLFFAHIPLESAELDEEARRYFARMENELAKGPAHLTKEEQERALDRLREVIYQHRVGHFLMECRVVDADQVLGVDTLELEVLFKGRFSDVGLPAVPPA